MVGQTYRALRRSIALRIPGTEFARIGMNVEQPQGSPMLVSIELQANATQIDFRGSSFSGRQMIENPAEQLLELEIREKNSCHLW